MLVHSFIVQWDWKYLIKSFYFEYDWEKLQFHYFMNILHLCRYQLFSFGKVITNYRADFALKLKGKV